MNEQAHPKLERFEQLLVDRATIGLDEPEMQELEQLAIELGVPIDDSVDLAAAAIDSLVATEELQPLPEHLKQAVIASAATVELGNDLENRTDCESNSVQPSATTVDEQQRLNVRATSTANAGGITRREVFSMLAAAACLLLAAFAWFSKSELGQVDPAQAAELRTQFLNANPLDLVKVSWQGTDEDLDGRTSGGVVWSSERQEGYMSFKGLPQNDASVEQYQLWIFDKNRDEKYPVDGGVFDISDTDTETVVMIDPKIEIDEATLFAITIERPGGVVVSDRSRLPLLAKVQ